MIENNPITFKQRRTELLFDYLVILGYLLGLLIVMMIIYHLILKSVPSYTETQTQLLTTFTSVVPIMLIFSYLDYKDLSVGKRKAGLVVYFEERKFRYCIYRNVIKFLPWQLGHMSVIRGLYIGFDWLSLCLYVVSIVLLIIMLWMALKRKDKRHLGDLLAKSQVQRLS